MEEDVEEELWEEMKGMEKVVEEEMELVVWEHQGIERPVPI